MQLSIDERKMEMLDHESTMKMEKLRAKTKQEHLNVEKEHLYVEKEHKSLNWTYYIRDSNF